MTKNFLKLSAERAAKTFVQVFLGVWMLRAGFLGTDLEQANSGAYDLLFTLDNVKAGVVGVALSFATSIGSKPFGNNPDSPSAVD